MSTHATNDGIIGFSKTTVFGLPACLIFASSAALEFLGQLWNNTWTCFNETTLSQPFQSGGGLVSRDLCS
jgi:hypothetical protein